MEKIDKSLKSYLAKTLDSRQGTCPRTDRLADYVAGSLPKDEAADFEKHISGCKDCLGKISMSMTADTLYKEGRPPSSSQAAAEKAKQIAAGRKPKIKSKRHVWLLAAIIAFSMSFIFPKYFLQCLVATILLGVKWIVESENARTFILVLDSWRKREHIRDEEISERLRDRGNIKNLK